MNISKEEGELIAAIYLWADNRKFDKISVCYVPVVKEWSFFGLKQYYGTNTASFSLDKADKSLYDLYEKITGEKWEIKL